MRLEYVSRHLAPVNPMMPPDADGVLSIGEPVGRNIKAACISEWGLEEAAISDPPP
jgi:hypothetical protein